MNPRVINTSKSKIRLE